MKKEELKRYKKEISNVKRMLGIIAKRLGEGRYTAAAKLLSGEAAMLKKLVVQLEELAEQKGAHNG